MSNQYEKKLISFTVCCHKLVSSLILFIKTMQLCKECVSWFLSYCVRSESFKCSECAAHTSWKCDLMILKVKWVKVQCECTHLCTELYEVIACVSWLQWQSDLIESHWDEMIQCEFQNIKELKVSEVCETSETAVMSFLNKFLLNMSSDQIEVSVNFDSWFWSENVSSKDTS